LPNVGATFVHDDKLCINVDKKGWGLFCVDFSQTHPVTLAKGGMAKVRFPPISIVFARTVGISRSFSRGRSAFLQLKVNK
jgi:hypothetical protein